MSVREKEKKPSAMKQVHNKVNAGIMDAVAYGGMCEAADPEDEEYQIGMEDGGLEPYAHTLKEGKEQLSEYQKYIKSFIQFLRSQHLSIDPLPEIELDDEEQDGLFIKTGYYSPDERKIVVFTNGRHIKDVMRTIAHEFVHHMQNVQDPDKDWGSNGDLEQDRKLRGIEGEAYLLGNILFREWTEYARKNEKNLNESRIAESPDRVDELGLVFYSDDAVPFMRLNDDGKFYVGNRGENHVNMISKITERNYDELYDEIDSMNFGYYVDLESTGRYWQKQNVISFWETPIQKKAKLLNVIGRLANSVEVNFRTLLIDWWDGENERLIPYRWLNNGTFEMLYPRGIKSVVPYMQPKYWDIDEHTMFRVVTEKDGGRYLVLDFSGDIVPLERRVGVGAINEVTDEIVEPADVALSSFNLKKHLNPKFTGLSRRMSSSPVPSPTTTGTASTQTLTSISSLTMRMWMSALTSCASISP